MKPTKKRIREQQELADTSFSYTDNIVRWRLEEGLWYTVDLVKEQLTLHEISTGSEKHALLVNTADNAVINLECMEQIISHPAPFRKAVAIVTGENLAAFIMVNFYLNKTQFNTAVKLFKTEERARVWLKEQLSIQGSKKQSGH